MKIVFAPDFAKSLARCFRSIWHPSNLWYRFKCWAWKRYTTVKPRWLDHTWCDCTDLLPHTMFEILGRFIEQECSPGCIEWYGEEGCTITVNGEDRYVRDEMQELWTWWSDIYVGERGKALCSYDARRAAIHAAIDQIDDASLISRFDESEESDFFTYNPKYKTADAAVRVDQLYKQLFALDKEAHEALQSMMHRLVNIRRYLWT